MEKRSSRGRIRMVVGFSTTRAVNAYHHLSLLEACDSSVVFSGYSGFLHEYNRPQRYNWNIVESDVKHHKQ
jgi:hypothetical protein